MAITTTSTADDLINAAFIEPTILAAASELAYLAPLCRQFNLVGKASGAIKVPTAPSLWGTPDDAGAGVDTEYDVAENADLSSTTFTTGGVTATAAEYGCRIDISDSLVEDCIDALELFNIVTESMVGALMFALDDDIVALLAGLSNSVGTSGSDLTVAQALAAQTGIRTRGMRARDGVAYILGQTQCDDLEGALVASAANTAVFSATADRFLGASPGSRNGLSDGVVMFFRNAPVYGSGFVDTANAGADDVGACFVPSSAGNDAFATFGLAMKRLPRLRQQRDESARSTEMILSMRAVAYELRDGSGTKIVTDA